MSLRDLVFNIFARDKTGRAFDAVSRKMDGLDRRAKAAKATLAGAGLGAGLTAPLAGFGAGILRAAGDFEAAMNRVAGISGATGEDLDRLRETAKRLGSETQFSASEAAQAMEFLAMAGFSATDSMSALPGTLNLAAASGLDLARSADIVSNVLTGYQKPVTDLAHVNDVLVKTMTSANASLEQIGYSMKYVGPIAATAGIEFEETAAAIGLLGNAGLQGEQAGTVLRGALSRMLQPTKAMRIAMTEAGISFTDAHGKLLPLTDVIRQLEPHASDAALMLKLFGQEAGPGMAALVSQGSGALEGLTQNLRDSTGEAERIGAINLDGHAGAIKQLSSAFEGLKLAIAESGFLAFMTDLALGLTSLVRWLSEADPILLKFATALGVVAAVAGPLVITLGALALAVGAISAPVALAIAGAVALGAAIYALWDPIKAVAGFIADVFIAAWQGLKAAFDLAMNSPLEFAAKLGELLLSFNPVVMGVKAIGAVFDWLFPASMDSIKKLVAGAKEWLLDKLTGIFDSVKNKIAAVGDAFYKLWDRVVGHSYIPDLVDDIGAEMDRLDGEFVDPAIRANDKVADSFRELAEDASNDLKDLARSGDLTMRSFFDTMLAAGKRWSDQMLDEVFDKLAKAASDKLTGIGGAGGSGGGGFLDTLVSFGASLLSGGGSGDALTDALNAAGASATAPAFDTGGEAALVGGRGGVDRNLVRLRLSEGERVQVTRRGQNPAAANVTVNITTPNPAAFQASRVQVAGQISRAVAYGQRGM